jgi:hypothetical protein
MDSVNSVDDVNIKGNVKHSRRKYIMCEWPITVAARFKAWIGGGRLLGVWVRIPPEGVEFVSCECYQLEVSATGSSLACRSPTDCGVSECDREAWIIRRPWPTRGCCIMGEKIFCVNF